MNIKNKKAKFNFEFIDSEIAGLVLKGSEIKSIRNGLIGFTDSYCFFDKNNELWVKNLHINEHKDSKLDPKRDRKILLTKQQLNKFQTKSKEKGLTIIPEEIFINEKGLAKMKISLAKGKKVHDKKQIIKENDIKRDMDRELKNYK